MLGGIFINSFFTLVISRNYNGSTVPPSPLGARFKLAAKEFIEKLFKEKKWYVGMAHEKVRTREDFKHVVRKVR